MILWTVKLDKYIAMCMIVRNVKPEEYIVIGMIYGLLN